VVHMIFVLLLGEFWHRVDVRDPAVAAAVPPLYISIRRRHQDAICCRSIGIAIVLEAQFEFTSFREEFVADE
jgi:hypothetical protein